MLMIFLFLLMDYLLTYIGIRINLIEEANPIMRHIFDRDLITGLLMRISYSLILVLLLYAIKRKKPLYYTKIVFGTDILYSLIILLHIRWIALL